MGYNYRNSNFQKLTVIVIWPERAQVETFFRIQAGWKYAGAFPYYVALIVGNTRIRKRARLDSSMASSIPSESRPDV